MWKTNLEQPIHRCGRCLRDQLYMDYHDTEWWIPVHDDMRHFEFLILETFQAWLSRYTVLAKRENFRRAFDGFDPHIVASYDDEKLATLMLDAGIIRNRAKIAASVTNARIFLDIQQEYWSRDAYIRGWTDSKTIDNHLVSYRDAPATSSLSDAISKDLKKRGMKFVGSTVIYAHLQATGQINDHERDCHCRQKQ